MSNEELSERIRARAAEVGADLIVLPVRTDEESGKAVYAQDDVLVVKRLRKAGVRAAYLDDSDERLFVSQNSAVLLVACTLALGLATNAAYDALKAAVTRLWGKDDSELRILITDATDTTPAEWTLTGHPATVLDAIEQLKARELLPADVTTDSQRHGTRPGELGPPSEFVAAGVDARLAEGRRLLRLAQVTFEEDPDQSSKAEAHATQALAKFRSALDWAEDTEREEETHRDLDTAGRWKRETFGCSLEYEDETYWQSCPVALGHQRVGLSVGGVAVRMCSICGIDFSECEHDPAETYLVAGGTAVGNHCRICATQDCAEHKRHLRYQTSPISIVTMMLMDEVSVVPRPAMKDARIMRQSISDSQLRRALGDQFTPGVPVSCDRCLRDCGGLIQMPEQIA